MTTLAEEFGVSGRGLAKICQCLRRPRYRRGLIGRPTERLIKSPESSNSPCSTIQSLSFRTFAAAAMIVRKDFQAADSQKRGLCGLWTKKHLRGAFLWVLIVTFHRAAAGTPLCAPGHRRSPPREQGSCCGSSSESPRTLALARTCAKNSPFSVPAHKRWPNVHRRRAAICRRAVANEMGLLDDRHVRRNPMRKTISLILLPLGFVALALTVSAPGALTATIPPPVPKRRCADSKRWVLSKNPGEPLTCKLKDGTVLKSLVKPSITWRY